MVGQRRNPDELYRPAVYRLTAERPHHAGRRRRDGPRRLGRPAQAL